ncbi:tetratricopeptide repeat protein [Streptomyces sp. NPDC093589]|uniref:tetratricopeptide repeat protein n=1 Tax=Streptomyces sp. NPDC093589 TaxID=3366043 RepID=UPI00380D8468
MNDGASFQADAREHARIYQAARDLHITYQQGDPPAAGTETPLTLAHLLSCFADAPLPAYVLSPEALAAVPVPGLTAERVAAELRALPSLTVDPDDAPGGPPIDCVQPGEAASKTPPGELTDDMRMRLRAGAAALLDRAMLRSRPLEGTLLDLLAAHVRALLWHPGGEPVRSSAARDSDSAPVSGTIAAARRVRDAYEGCGRYDEGLPFAVRIVQSGAASPVTDGLVLGQLHVGCGDFGEAEAVLRPVLALVEQEATGRGLTVAGLTGPSIAEIFRDNSPGPYTSRLTAVDCEVLAQVAAVQHTLCDALYGLRRYPECERLLRTAVGLRLRVLGAAHPAWMLTQLRRARVLGRQRLWREAMGFVHDALVHRDRAELDRDRPRDAALLRLAHAEVTVEAVRSLQEEGAGRSRGVGMFPAPVVRLLDRTVGGNPQPEKLTWDDARRLVEEAASSCERAFGPTHPHTQAARSLRDRAVQGNENGS